MALLATEGALDLLVETSNAACLEGRLQLRLADVQSLFADDLDYLEATLAQLTADGERPATEVAPHLLGSGGKRIRPLTVLLSAACFGSVSAAARELAVVSELVHSATLLHDDVVDDGMERRGKVTARRLWGNAVSVLTGDLLLTHALDRTLAAAPEAMPDLLRTLRRLVDGEIIQLRGRTVLDLSEAVYFRILRDKTGSLFGWAARAGAQVGGAGEDELEAVGHFGEAMGVAFQLVDDALDYAGDPSATGKAVLADLLEGKVTLPLVLALAREPSLGRELDLARAGDELAAARLGLSVQSLGVCEIVRRRAMEETARAISALEAIPASPARLILAMVAEELTTRTR